MVSWYFEQINLVFVNLPFPVCVSYFTRCHQVCFISSTSFCFLHCFIFFLGLFLSFFASVGYLWLLTLTWLCTQYFVASIFVLYNKCIQRVFRVSSLRSETFLPHDSDRNSESLFFNRNRVLFLKPWISSICLIYYTVIVTCIVDPSWKPDILMNAFVSVRGWPGRPFRLSLSTLLLPECG